MGALLTEKMQPAGADAILRDVPEPRRVQEEARRALWMAG
jgi:hypothetical protein